MEYAKKAITFEEQANLLLSRGLEADKDNLVYRLSAVSYYRLSGYFYPFRKKDEDFFEEGTKLETVWDRYCFDRKLRGWVLDAIERIEVAVRTKLVYEFAHKCGPFGYCDEKNIPNLKAEEYIELRQNLLVETQRSKEEFKKHFFKKYKEHKNLPIWMVSELMSMGSLLTFLKGVSPEIQAAVAGSFSLPDELFFSWLRSLYGARNICAHHARFWNRVLGTPPKTPHKNKFPDWHLKDEDNKFLIKYDRSGIILMLCRYMLSQITETSRWHHRIEDLFNEFPEIPYHSMGLPSNWKEHPLWKLEKRENE